MPDADKNGTSSPNHGSSQNRVGRRFEELGNKVDFAAEMQDSDAVGGEAAEAAGFGLDGLVA